MPIYNDIIRTLHIKEDNIESIDYAFKNNHSYYFIKIVSRGVFCPKCGQYITSIHSYDSKSLTHSIFISHNTTIIYKKRYILEKAWNNEEENNNILWKIISFM